MKRTAKCYLVLKQGSYREPVITRMTKEKPRMNAGEIAVRVSLEVDSGIFTEFIPVVAASVTPGSVIIPEIEIEEEAQTDE